MGSSVSKESNEKESSEKDNLEKKVSAMIISEFPLDSVVGTSQQMLEAKVGVINYVKEKKPDVIFVDGLFTRVRYPEDYVSGILETEPLRNLMDEPFRIGSEFLKMLKEASPDSQIIYVLSDADEDNIRRLTKYAALKTVESNIQKLKEYDSKIKRVNEQIKEAKKAGKDTGRLTRRKGAYLTNKKRFTDNPGNLLRMPNAESPEWLAFKEQTSKDYIEKLTQMNPGVQICMGTVSLNIKGNTFLYSHNFQVSSDVPLKSDTNRLIELVNKMQMGNVPLPDFILESGHHAETMAHPQRHGLEDKYSFIATGMVMEDQNIVRQILDNKFKPEIFHGKQSKIEACKRTSKKMPAPGIMIVGRDEEGFFAEGYSVHHLSKVGRGEINIKDMRYETINIVADSHIGKGAVRYGALKAALKKIEDEIDACVKEGRSAPIFVNPNESLQGQNYKTMPVETSRKIPEEFEEELRAKIEEAKKEGKSLEELTDGLIYEMVEELNRTNEPRIINQVDRYHILFNPVVLKTLLYCKYDIAAIFNEATHIQHSVGQFGITEVGLETLPYKILDQSLALLEKEGVIKIDPNFKKRLYKKIKACEWGLSGYERLELKMGDIIYSIATEHKPGSARPNSNIPMLQIKRAITMADYADIHISAHLHTPYFFLIGKQASNNISAFYKGATFNEYDSFGQEIGWSPAVVGYEKAIVPINKGGDGVYKVKYILSDVLDKKTSH